MKIIETNLDFASLSERNKTDMIVIHHTGCNDIDASAEQIHGWHLGQGWAGIGYHFVIRKNGSIERGRPEWAIGSHAYGENSHTIGIHLSGDFESAQPTKAQIDNCAELIEHLAVTYCIPIDRKHIVGHCDLMATDCPGHNLYKKLDLIIAKAQGLKSDAPISDNPAACNFIDNVACYGLFGFNTKDGSLNKFIDWLRDYPDKDLAHYASFLNNHPLNSWQFTDDWKHIGEVDPGHFAQLQKEFVQQK